MKKIINGKRYDTETATKIGETSASGLPMNDFGYWEASLYKTRNGGFFLAGEGHAMTRFGSSHSDGTSGWGSSIEPMTESEAMAWAERHFDVETVEEHFSHLVEEA